MKKVRGMGVDENDEAGLHGTRGSLLDLGVARMELKRPDHDQDQVLWTPPLFTITVGSNLHMLILFTILLFLGVLLTIKSHAVSTTCKTVLYFLHCISLPICFLTVLIKQKTHKKKKKRGLIDVVHAQLLWSATVREKNKKLKK
jgi:hypothetical protein